MHKDILKQEYDFIFGIGQACSCSETLRLSGLQFQSYPLDWLFGGSITSRMDLLLNNFENFINKDDLTKVGERENPLPCDIYYNNSNGLTFNHDFALRQDINDTYPSVKEKYDRRIKRLYDNIEKSNKILIVYIQTPMDTKPTGIREILKEYYAKLSERFPNKEINIAYLVRKKWLLPFVYKENITKNIVMIKANYRNKDKSTEPFVVDGKMLVKIFSKVKLNKNVITNQEKKTWVMQ